MTGHSVRFDKGSMADVGGGGHSGSRSVLAPRRRKPYQSQQNLNRLNRYGSRAASMYRLNHLNPQQKRSIGKSYVNIKEKEPKKSKDKNQSVSVPMEPHKSSQRSLFSNKHIASAHRLISSIPDDDPNFKTRLRAVMNTYNFQIMMVVLIILDCVMVLGEMIIELRLFNKEDCPHHAEGSGGGHGKTVAQILTTTMAPLISTTLNPILEKSGISLENETLLDSGVHGAIEGGHGAHGAEHATAHVGTSHSDCEYTEHLLHNVEHVFHLTSIFILFLFNVELAVRLYAESYKYFLHLEIALDALIVMVSFGLDILFLDHKMKKYLYLLIILRVWRVLRVVHAIITAIRAPHERQIEKLKKKKKMLQRDLAKAYFYSNMLEEEIRNLRNYIDSFEIVEEVDDDYRDYVVDDVNDEDDRDDDDDDDDDDNDRKDEDFQSESGATAHKRNKN